MRLVVMLTALAGLLLGGCGFALRGSAIPLPERFAKTYLEESHHSDNHFERRIQQLIELGGGRLVAREAAEVSLKVGKIEVKSRQIALSSDGYNKEYERTYRVKVTVVDLKTEAQLGSRYITSTQNLQLDDRYVIAGDEESETTQRAAERELSYKIMQYLKTL